MALASAIGLLALLVWVLHSCDRWFCCCCRNCLRRTGTAGAVSAPNIDLPPERVVRGFPAITLHAPHEALPADTKFYQKEIRGRCNGRKSHDLILKFDSGVARIQGDRTQRRSQRTREELERADWVCIFVDVSSVLSFHCSSFAACDAEALVDLGAYARMSAWRLFVLLGRGCLRGRVCLRRFFRACCGSTRRASTSPRQMEERGVLRALDQDSEAEAGVSPDQASGTAGLNSARRGQPPTEGHPRGRTKCHEQGPTLHLQRSCSKCLNWTASLPWRRSPFGMANAEHCRASSAGRDARRLDSQCLWPAAMGRHRTINIAWECMRQGGSHRGVKSRQTVEHRRR